LENPLAYAPALLLLLLLLLLLQDIAYSYRVWITLNKRPYALLRYLKIDPNIHRPE